ncbi:MAG: hypothetical protein GY906_33355 [bacterium]|nr:hypothetical protein [bacterium]
MTGQTYYNLRTLAGGKVDYCVEEREGGELCVVQVTGELRRPEDSHFLRRLARNIISEKGLKRFLFDLREAAIVGGTLEAYQAGVQPPRDDLDVFRGKAALVYSEITADDQFLENVLVNRGSNLRAFAEFDAAVRWLNA